MGTSIKGLRQIGVCYLEHMTEPPEGKWTARPLPAHPKLGDALPPDPCSRVRVTSPPPLYAGLACLLCVLATLREVDRCYIHWSRHTGTCVVRKISSAASSAARSPQCSRPMRSRVVADW